MIKKDYYEVLEIDRQADGTIIKKAYRQLALKFHPDRNPDDHTAEDRFKEASEAYEVLSDPQKKQIYDQYGHQGLDRQGYHGFGEMNDIFSSFGDVFEEFFGGFGNMGFGFGRSGGRQRPRQGADLRHDITISFEEAAFGMDHEIAYKRNSQCEDCEGSGLEPGTSRETCSVCGGSGQMSHRQGFFMIQTTCRKCHGAGEIISNPCKKCRGSGKELKERKINVKIPAGVMDGMRLVLRGEGESGENSGPPGDMYVFISVKSHDYYVRYENDIHHQIEIGIAEAALGINVEVPTLYGKENISVHSGSQTGDQIKLKGKGIPDVQTGKKGNQIIFVKVVTPKKLSKKQKKLLQEFLKES